MLKIAHIKFELFFNWNIMTSWFDDIMMEGAKAYMALGELCLWQPRIF
jgi:hypothetical protein